MNFYRFINSKDVREYLQELNYQFTAPEAAFVVYRCSSVTLEEKISAWMEIINTMPNCSMEERLNLIRIDSFHSFLKDYVELLKRSIENFISDDGCIYSYAYQETENNSSEWYGKFETIFSNYEACIDYCRKEVLSEDYIDKIRVFKYAIYPQNRRIESITYDKNMEIEDIDFCTDNDYETGLALAFDGMCFDFPTPFKRGDILIDYRRNKESWRRPFVLSYVSTWNSQEMMKKGFHTYDCPDVKGWDNFDRISDRLRRDGDTTDMGVIGCVLMMNMEIFIKIT